MAYDYLDITNEVIARMNEVALTTVNFAMSINESLVGLLHMRQKQLHLFRVQLDTVFLLIHSQ